MLVNRFLKYNAYEKYREKSNKAKKDAKWPNRREYLFFEGKEYFSRVLNDADGRQPALSIPPLAESSS
jgi:hypothetical protein